MIPVDFPQANITFGPPEGLTEHQVKPIRAFDGTIEKGSLEGSRIIVVAWAPTFEDLEKMAHGEPIFIGFVGGLPPHLVSMDFDVAKGPA